MMILRMTILLLVGIVFISYSLSQRIRAESKQNLRVRINVTEDTIVLRFIHPNPDVKLEGYVLGFGSNMFSKHYIQLPENGELYEAEMDAEPKYLVAVQPAPPYDVKKHCTGQVDLERPLHLVIGTVTPTSVLLSWGAILHTPFQGNIMNDCLEDGHYTVRYRERNKKWNYEMCPTTDTVVDNLKPHTPYEFGVRANKEDESGQWSKPVVHSTDMTEKSMQDPYMPRTPSGNPVVFCFSCSLGVLCAKTLKHWEQINLFYRQRLQGLVLSLLYMFFFLRYSSFPSVLPNGKQLNKLRRLMKLQGFEV